MRIGQGFDVHAFGEGDSVVLGGVRIAHSHGLKAHSDGDVLAHALCDALIGAAGLGDIGQHFPDSDPAFAGVDSMELLLQVGRMLFERGLVLVNADTTVVAAAPRLAPMYRMRERMAAVLGVDRSRVNVKATTTEGLGFTGRGEGIAAFAAVLLDDHLITGTDTPEVRVTAIEDPLAGLPYAFGVPCTRALIRSTPEDFRVTELPLVEPDGSGQHLLARIRKRNCTTPDVARELANQCGVVRRAVSWAGLKDRQAVTEQWFSIDLAGRPDPGLTSGQGFEVLEARRHGRKLRRGALAGNAFELLLREVDGDREEIEARLARVSHEGVPNYFGPQRFGRRGDNTQQALAMFSGKLRIRGREQRAILLSAARSQIFNAILGERVRAGDWHRARSGDVLQWQGSRSHFLWDGGEAERIESQVAALELHPTGALWGRQGSQAAADVAAREEAIAAKYPELADGLVAAGMDSDRRALRLVVRKLEWTWQGDTLGLCFELPPGAYATTVLREVLSD